ncbi:hypothetical protein, conserved [Eimeria praecox]|uniref:ELM2 domain-containing protein n=1 Tax=Eimeria praecox TaxID=51316 RepID=U6GIQ3_9EIME|nr:hypothetical protein, conserved [Eimeria praecox]
MGILSCPSDAVVAAAAANPEDGKSACASTAAETANTSVPSGATELETTEPRPQPDASDEDPAAPRTWSTCCSEKQRLPETTNGQGEHASEDQCASGNDEQQVQQQEGSGCLSKEGSAECAACGKDQPEVGNSQEGRPGMCETCNNSKAQTSRMPNELQKEGAIDPSSQVEQSSGATAPEDTPQRRQGAAEGADETSAKTPAAARSGSSSSGGSGPSTSSSRARGASAVASSGGAATAAGAAFPSAAGAAAATGAPRKCIDEGSVRRHVVPVGPRHQVPCLPPFFLENGGFGCCCGEPSPALDPSLTAKLVYSPSSLERVRQRRLAEGLADRAICTEGDMEAFMQQCAKNWKGNKPGWQPFSPEFAFKLLHYAGYDPAKALQLMEDPQFSFQLVCDGPVRRYDNKWRPKDRRGVISPTPYPPPVFLRGYLSRRHYRDSTGYSLR